MKSLVAVSCALAALFASASVSAIDGNLVNARAVSIHYRHGWDNWGGACCECYERVPKGSIHLYTIINSVVEDVDVIYERELGFAQYPAFNYNATKIAFFRYGSAPVAPDPDPPSCQSVNGGKNYLSVIDIDGGNIVDLCELPGSPGAEQSLDWPAGDWIYYVNPADDSHARGGESVDVWRVNSQTGQNERVCDLTDNTGGHFECAWFRRMTFDAEANYMAAQIFGGTYGCDLPEIAGGGNAIYNWPTSNCNLETSKAIGHCCCNIAISPGAEFIGWYMGGSHDDLYIERIDPGAGSVSGVGTYNMDGDLGTWAGEELGNGAELVRWSVNSDKWVLQNFGWEGHAGSLYDGSNAVVCNWVDQVAINISKNPNQPGPNNTSGGDGTIYLNNCAGDIWIDGGAENIAKYEDEDGVWHDVSGVTSTDYVPASVSGTITTLPYRSSGTVKLAADAVVTVVDSKGRCVLSVQATSGEFDARPLIKTPGAYVMRILSGASERTLRFSVYR